MKKLKLMLAALLIIPLVLVLGACEGSKDNVIKVPVIPDKNLAVTLRAVDDFFETANIDLLIDFYDYYFDDSDFGDDGDTVIDYYLKKNKNQTIITMVSEEKHEETKNGEKWSYIDLNLVILTFKKIKKVDTLIQVKVEEYYTSILEFNDDTPNRESTIYYSSIYV